MSYFLGRHKTMPKLEERDDAAQRWLERKESEPVAKRAEPGLLNENPFGDDPVGWWARTLKPGFAPWEPNCFEQGGDVLTVSGVEQKPAAVFHEVPDAEFQRLQKCARWMQKYASRRSLTVDYLLEDVE